jgi:subtilase family serine protease
MPIHPAIMQFTLAVQGFPQAQLTGAVAQAGARTPIQVTNHSAQLIGPYDRSQKLRLVFGLKPPKAEEERRFLDALYTEGSSQYHKFLTAKEGNDRFSPSAEDEQAVVIGPPHKD